MIRRLQDQSSPFIRAGMGGYAVNTWFSAFVNPESTFHEISTTPDGGLIIWTMGLFGVLLLVDLFINDWTPDWVSFGRRKLGLGWERVWQYRHWLFVGIAACYAAQPQIADASGQSKALLVSCYFPAFLNIWAAFIDAGERSRSLWWQRTYN